MKNLLAFFILTACSAVASDLDVMTFNVRYNNPGDAENAWPKRKSLVADFLTQTTPDLVGLQEALKSQQDDILASNPEFAAVGVGRDDGKSRGEFSSILFRSDTFTPLENGTFWLSATPAKIASTTWGNDIPRICTWARFRIKTTGETFYLFNTHFDHRSQPSREKSAQLILERISQRRFASDPVILTGDFNASETNPAITALGASLTETFRAVDPDAVDVGTFHGFKPTNGRDKIDYVFTSPDITIKKATIHRPRPGGRYVTDHEPVSASLTLPTRKKN